VRYKFGKPRSKPRGMCSLIPGFGGILQGVHVQDLDAAWRAVTERVLFIERNGAFELPPDPVNPLNVEFKRYSDQLVRAFRAKYFGIEKWSYDQFIDTMLPRRRDRYRSAKADLLSGRVIVNPIVEAFLKREKVSFETKDPAPRLIQPMPDIYLLEAGCYIKPLEKLLLGVIAETFDCFISKGKQPHEIGRWIHEAWNEFSDPVCIDLDVSRFDQHVSESALKYEFDVYNGIWKESELARLLKMQINTRRVLRVHGEGDIWFRPVGGRLSGVPNTGLGNVVIMCTLLRAYCDRFPSRRFKLLDNGDDCNVILDRQFLPEFRAGLVDWFRDRGFTLKIENVAYDIYDIEHCQASPAFVLGRMTMIKKVRRTVTREGNTVRSVRTEEDWNYYRSAISCGGVHDFQGVPIIQDWYWKMGEGTSRTYDMESPLGRHLNRFEWRYLKGMMPGVATYRSPDHSSRSWFAYKYKVLCAEQLDVEEKIKNLTVKWSHLGQDVSRRPVGQREYLNQSVHYRWPYVWAMGSE